MQCTNCFLACVCVCVQTCRFPCSHSRDQLTVLYLYCCCSLINYPLCQPASRLPIFRSWVRFFLLSSLWWFEASTFDRCRLSKIESPNTNKERRREEEVFSSSSSFLTSSLVASGHLKAAAAAAELAGHASQPSWFRQD